MELDVDTCYRAIEARDARFDGVFFTGVRSTRIFCRPVCPARTPLRRNVEFFPNAAAAQSAGYRPCLRCRPELSPGRPAWSGTSATVARALRLIEEGALDEGSTAKLAGRLGMTDRHLRRLFLEHLGAAPSTVAQTRRVLFAKQLITETDLPFTQIAYAAGFTSLRRFNQAMQEVYRANPRELRRSAPAQPQGLELRLHYRPPYNWEALRRFLAPRAIPGFEEIDEQGYSRGGTVAVRHSGKENSLVVRIRPEGATATLRAITERLRRMFDLRASSTEIDAHLSRSTVLQPLVARSPGIRLPGCWDAFELGVRAILGQQVTVKGATTLMGRVVERFGPVKPEVLAYADLSEIGLPRSRRETLAAFARAFAEERLGPDLPSEECIGRMCELPGIGPWTANYFAMRALGDPDAFPASDLGLLKASGAASAKELLEMAEAWRPWRAYAAFYLWESLV